MRRREFITLLGGALTSRPFPANAQPAPRMRTVGALIGLADDAEARARSMAFEQGLEKRASPSAKTFASSTAMPKAILRACRLLRTSSGGAQARLHRGPQHARCDGADACDSGNSDRIRVGFRSDRQRIRRERGAS